MRGARLVYPSLSYQVTGGDFPAIGTPLSEDLDFLRRTFFQSHIFRCVTFFLLFTWRADGSLVAVGSQGRSREALSSRGSSGPLGPSLRSPVTSGAERSAQLEREIAHLPHEERSAPRPDLPGNFAARIWQANRDILGNAAASSRHPS